MIIKNFVKGLLHNNNYLLIDEETKEAILIDCSRSDDDIMEYVKQEKLNLKYILLTHGHYDHVLGLSYFQNKYNVDFWVHKNDIFFIENLNLFTKIKENTDIPKIKNIFDENKKFYLGKKQIKVIHTPGHTEGSCCFLIDNYLFSGDTMFFENCGRTDLYGGNLEDLKKSLYKLLLLPPKTIVYPGHGKATTIEHEKETYNFKC